MTRPPDFQRIEPHHEAVHERLRNWSRWVIVRPARLVHPMFRMYRPAQHWDAKEFREPCDTLDAMMVEKIIYKLPEKHREAVRWWYVYQCTPVVAIRALGLTYEGLNRHVRDGRQMMLNLLD